MTRSTLAIAGGRPVLPEGMERRWPLIRRADRRAIERVLARGELWGPNAEEVTRLQDDWAAFVRTPFCLLVNSGTAALHCALVGAGIQPGDEVIVPAFGFVATPMSVLHAGAVPVFCDIDPVTYNLDVNRIEQSLTDRTAAILPVHTHGLPADMQEIRSLARRHGLAVVEDAAQAHGATYRGSRAGALGDTAAFSLNGSKLLSAGEGGLFVTSDEKAFTAARRLAIFGEDTPPLGPNQYRSYWSHGMGWNYRSHELTAALAGAQLGRLDQSVVRAQRNARLLDAGLRDLPGLATPYVPDDRTCSYYRYRIRIDADELGFRGPPRELRDRLLWALQAEGIAASLWQLLPLPAQPVFRRGSFRPSQPADRAELSPWDPSACPSASQMLESSIVIGTGSRPLWAQPATVAKQYVEAFGKVTDHLDTVLSAPYEPVEPWPPHE